MSGMSALLSSSWQEVHVTESGLVMQGIVISCCLICAVLFCSAAWDYILQYWAAFAPHVLPPLDRVQLHLSTTSDTSFNAPKTRSGGLD